MTHPDITLNVEGGGSCEPESLHVCIDYCLVHRVSLRAGSLKLGYQFLIHRTTGKSKQLINEFKQNY